MEQNYNYLIIEEFEHYFQLWLNRPEKHNAFNNQMIQELTEALKKIEKSKKRFVVIRGKGKSFCSGADLSWMIDASTKTKEDNKKDAGHLAKLLYTLHNLSVPVIAITHGAAYGGAIGLISACDFIWADKNSTFCLSEAKLGLSPSTIMPYIQKRLSKSYAKELIFTTRQIDSNEAFSNGLIDKIITPEQIELTIDSFLQQIKNSAPGAITESKKLINQLPNNINKEVIDITIDSLADRRSSDEAKKGINAFLNKEKVNWD